MRKLIERMKRDWRENRFVLLHRMLAALMALVMVASVMPEMVGDAKGTDTMYFYSAYPDGNSYSEYLEGSALAKDITSGVKTPPEPRERGTVAQGSFVGYSPYNATRNIAHDSFTASPLLVSSYWKKESSSVKGSAVTGPRYRYAYQFYALPVTAYLYDSNGASLGLPTVTVSPDPDSAAIGSTTVGYTLYLSSMASAHKWPTAVTCLGQSTFIVQSQLAQGYGNFWFPYEIDRGNPTSVNSNTKKNCAVRVNASKPWVDLKITYRAADKYQVIYHPNGASGSDQYSAQVWNDGIDKATIAANTWFSRPHYSFIGWNTNANGTGTNYAAATQTLLHSNLHLYAQWKQSDFHVNYNANGATAGTAPTDGTWYATGNNATVAGSNGLKKNQKVFAGWNTKADGTGTDYAPGSSITIGSSDVTLYAKWTNAPTWTLTYDKGDPDATGAMAQETYYDDGITDSAGNPVNAKVTVKPSAFTKPNSTFKNWVRDDGTLFNPSQIFYMDADHTLTARWGGVLTYDSDGATVGAVPTDSTVYDIGDNAIAKDRFPGSSSGTTPNPNRLRRDHYVFTGWDNASGQDNGNPPDYAVGADIPMTQNKTVYAHWAPATEYQVEYDLNPPGGLSASDMVGTLPTDSTSYYKDELNEEITVKTNSMALPKHYFSKWRDKDTGNLYSPGQSFNLAPAHSSMPDKIHLEAVWNPAPPYTVTYDENLPAGVTLDSGSAPVDTNSPYYNDGINNMVTVLGDNGMTMSGYEFAGWNTKPDGSGADYVAGDTFNIGSVGTSVTLYAKWRKGLTITGVNNPNKVYDATPNWTGTITFSGKNSGDHVSISYASAAYEHVSPLLADKDAEAGKKLLLGGLTLTGSDADKYYIKDASTGTYTAATATTPSSYETTGDITPRPVTITPGLTTGATGIWEGDTVPNFTCNVTSGTMAPGELVSPDLGTPTYVCEKVNADGTIDTLTPGSPASVIGGYKLKVSGLSNQNYTLTLQDQAITVHPAGSNLARVTYHAGNHGLGTPPSDSTVYYTFPANPSANSHVTVLPKGGLYNPGCTFLGWNTNPNGTDTMTKADGTTTNLFVPGDSFVIQGDTDLYAIWQGATPLTLTGITPLSRPYDGTDSWSGTISANVPAGENVTVTYTAGAYDNKNAGTGKTITLTGIALTGADAYKYHLVNGGMYNSTTNEIKVTSGEITPLPITVRADMTPNILNENDPVPTLSIGDVSISPSSPNGLVGGDSLATDFGTPTFTISDLAGNTLTPGSPATPAGIYNVAVSGLSNSNYAITVENTQVSVSSATLGIPIQVTYDANHSHATGLVPADSNIYYNTAPHDIVPVLSHDGGLAGGAGGGAAPVPGAVHGSLSVPGCTFTGWNTKADGTGITVKTDGLSTNRLQAGDAFSIAGIAGVTNIKLYAQWTPDYPLTIQSLSDTSKVYDNSDAWGGSFTLDGIQPGDDVQLTWTDGKFDSKDVGNRIITAENLQLTGTDAYKYYLTPDTNGWYDVATNKVTYPNAQITKRPITIKAQVTSANPVKAGSTPPTYSYQHIAGTFAPGESIADIDDSGVTYTLTDTSGNPVNFASITTAAMCLVKVSGLVNDNYDITYLDEFLRVADEDKVPAMVIYSAPDKTGGSVPEDNNVYMVYYNPGIPKPQATILGEGDLERSGYAFAGWKDKNTGNILQPGDVIAVSDMVYLEAMWTADTPLTIIDLTDKEKTYDGNADWTGQPVLDGVIPGDDVKVEYDNGKYAAKDAGQRVIRLENVRLTGADAAKYVLVGSSIYDADERSAEADGKIKPLKIEVLPVVQGFAPGFDPASAPVIKKGDPIPPYELYLPAASHIIAPDQLSDFGTPVYTCKNYRGEEIDSNGAPGYYRLSVSGLSHANYDLETDSTLVALWAPGMKPAKVTYKANGGHGAPPVDNNIYATFDDKSLNNIVTVLGNTLTRRGYKFIGWNTKANGHGITYQPGDEFRIQGDITLYAKWEKIKKPDKPKPDKPKPPKPDDPKPKKPTPDNPNPTNPQPNKPQPGKPVLPGVEPTVQKPKARDNTKETQKNGSFKMKSMDSSQEYLAGFYDEDKIPRASNPFSAKQKQPFYQSLLGSNLGPIADCIIHWLLLLLTLAAVLYDALRYCYIKAKGRTEASKLFDRLLPILAEPLALVLFLYRRCVLDLWFALACYAIVAIGAFLLNRYYSNREMEEMEELKER